MRCLLVFLGVGLAMPLLHADEASKRAKIEEIFVATNVQGLMLQQQSQIRTMIHQMVVQSAPQLAGNQMMEEFEQTSMDDIQKVLSWESLKPEMIKIYADTFTEEELNGLSEFYKSPAGQAMIKKLPTVMSKTMAIAQARMGEELPRLQQHLQDIVKKYQQQGK